MLTRQQKIDAIYEKIARKDLSFGCRVKWEEAEYRILKAIQPHRLEAIPTWYRWYGDYGTVVLTPISEYEIIGHPVMIGDVLDYFWNKKWVMTLDRILRFWGEKTKTIEEQSDKCVDYIYNLISK